MSAVETSSGVTRVDCVKGSYRWQIQNFSLLDRLGPTLFCDGSGQPCCDCSTSVESPPFEVGQAQFRLRLYAFGNQKESPEQLALYIRPLNAEPVPQKLLCDFSLLSSAGTIIARRKFPAPEPVKVSGYSNLVARSELLPKLVDDTLIVTVELSVIRDTVSIQQQPQSQGRFDVAWIGDQLLSTGLQR